MMFRRFVLAPLVAALAACGGDDQPPDAAPIPCPVGDPSQPAQLEVFYLDDQFAHQPTTAGQDVPLHFPPQGGWILLLGAKATNIDACRVSITTSLHELCGGVVIGVDRRPTRLEDTGDGWARTTVNDYGNLPVCPQAVTTRDLHDQPYVVKIELDDINGQHAEASIEVKPICPDPDPTGLCLCQCDHNYTLGASCPVNGADAGPLSCDAGM